MRTPGGLSSRSTTPQPTTWSSFGRSLWRTPSSRSSPQSRYSRKTERTRSESAGEPQLGRRGLYRKIGGETDEKAWTSWRSSWVLNLSDGRHNLLDIATRQSISFARGQQRGRADRARSAGGDERSRRLRSDARQPLRRGQRRRSAGRGYCHLNMQQIPAGGIARGFAVDPSQTHHHMDPSAARRRQCSLSDQSYGMSFSCGSRRVVRDGSCA